MYGVAELGAPRWEDVNPPGTFFREEQTLKTYQVQKPYQPSLFGFERRDSGMVLVPKSGAHPSLSSVELRQALAQHVPRNQGQLSGRPQLRLLPPLPAEPRRVYEFTREEILEEIVRLCQELQFQFDGVPAYRLRPLAAQAVNMLRVLERGWRPEAVRLTPGLTPGLFEEGFDALR